jgi:hypothetical protein
MTGGRILMGCMQEEECVRKLVGWGVSRLLWCGVLGAGQSMRTKSLRRGRTSLDWD